MENLFQNLEFIGMFCLGAFVAGVMNYGLSNIKDTDTFSKVSASIFGAAFSGIIFIFLEFLLKKQESGDVASFKSVFMYPVGLLLSLLWLQMNETIDKRILANGEPSKQIVGWLHFIGLSALTVLIGWRLLLGDKIH